MMEEVITIVKEEICTDAIEQDGLPGSDPFDLPDSFAFCTEPPSDKQPDPLGIPSDPDIQHLNAICLNNRIAIIRCFYSSSNCPTTALQMFKEEDNNICVKINVEDINFLVQKFEKTGSLIGNHIDNPILDGEDYVNPHSVVETIYGSPIKNNVKAVEKGNSEIGNLTHTVFLQTNELSEDKENPPHNQAICLRIRVAIIRCFYSSSSCSTTALQMLKEEDKDICVTFNVEDINFFVQKFEKTGCVISPHMETEETVNPHNIVETIYHNPIENNTDSGENGNTKIRNLTRTVFLQTDELSVDKECSQNKEMKSERKVYLRKKNKSMINYLEVDQPQSRVKKRKRKAPEKMNKKIIQRFPPLGINECRICKKKCHDSPSFKYHFLSHFNMTFLPKDGPPRCPGCHKSFTNNYGFYVHLFHKCLLEKYDSTESQQNLELTLDSSVTVDSPPEIPKEDPCLPSVQSPSSLEEQVVLSQNSKKKVFECPRCPKILPNKHSLTYHVLEHFDLSHLSGNPPYSCPECGHLFLTKQNLYKHLSNSCHKGKKRPETPFSCHLCNKAFQFELQLEHHVLVHSGQAKLKVCHLCGKEFDSTSGFRKHLIVFHSEKKAFQCDECPKYYSTSKYLEEHKLSHSGTYLYTCGTCGKKCDSGHSYQSHLHSHTSKMKRWQCEICGKDFSGTYSYKKHMRTHTGEVIAVCDLCGRGFTRKENLKIHVKSCQKHFQY